MIIDHALQFVSVLLATLIGVYSAFLLDHWKQEQKARKQAGDHLQSIKSELQTNLDRAESNRQLIKHLQRRKPEGDHYLLEPLETDAWKAAVEEPILGTVSNELYDDLQDLYSDTKLANSLISRQRDEMHHETLGEEEGTGGYTYEVWTINVDYYDEDKERVATYGLGPRIRDEFESIVITSEIIEEIDSEIENLREYSLKDHIFRSVK
jgi:hypothetical protein